MEKELLDPFNQLQERKQTLLNRLESIEDAVLHIQEGEGKWSICQILVHLIETERLSLAYCKKKIKAGDGIPQMKVIDYIKRFWFSRFIRTNIRFKTQPMLSNPTNELSFTEILKRWESVTQHEREFLTQFPKEYLGKAVFRHPLAGRIKIRDMILFFDGHIAHHEHQINRTLLAIR